MSRKLALLGTILTLFAGCAGTQVYNPIAFNPDSQTAMLYVNRPKSIWGSAIASPVYVNNQLIGRIGPGGSIETKIPAGRNSVSVTTSDIIINADSGSSYYAKVTMPFQIWWMTPSFRIKQIEKRDE